MASLIATVIARVVLGWLDRQQDAAEARRIFLEFISQVERLAHISVSLAADYRSQVDEIRKLQSQLPPIGGP